MAKKQDTENYFDSAKEDLMLVQLEFETEQQEKQQGQGGEGEGEEGNEDQKNKKEGDDEGKGKKKTDKEKKKEQDKGDEKEGETGGDGKDGDGGKEGDSQRESSQPEGKGKKKGDEESEGKEESEGDGEKTGEEKERDRDEKEKLEKEKTGGEKDESDEKEGEEKDEGKEGDGNGKGGQKEPTEKDAKRSIRNAENSLKNIGNRVSSEQDKKVVQDALKQLGEQRDRLAEGKGTPQEIMDKVADISQKALNGIKDTLDKANQELNQHYPSMNPVIQQTKPCGTLEKQPDYTPEDKIIGNSRINDIATEIKDNPFDYKNLKDILMASAGIGKTAGGGLTTLTIQGWVTHDWIQQLKLEIKNFLKSRRKVKEDYDYPEMQARGVGIVKTKSKKHKKQKTIYFILDTSGSMFWYKSKGAPLVQVMVEYLLPLLKKYEGELWENDTRVEHKIDFRQLKAQYFKDKASASKSLKIRGMGGTEFKAALREIKNMKENKEIVIDGKRKKMKHAAEFLTVLATDSDANWNEHRGLFPEDFILLTIRGRDNYPNLNPDLNQKIIYIDVDDKK